MRNKKNVINNKIYELLKKHIIDSTNKFSSVDSRLNSLEKKVEYFYYLSII